MKKIFIFSVAIGLGLITLSACTKPQVQQPEVPVFNASEAAEEVQVEPIKLEAGNYLIMPEASQLSWYGKRILGSDHSGLVKLKSGNFIVENELITGGEFLIDMTSISSNESNEKLVEHLRGADFFEVEKYEEAKLVINGSELSPESSFLVKADLTIKDITVPLEFQANFEQEEGALVALSDLTIDRTLWDIRYGSGSFYKNLGNAAIENEIGFKVYLQAVKE